MAAVLFDGSFNSGVTLCRQNCQTNYDSAAHFAHKSTKGTVGYAGHWSEQEGILFELGSEFFCWVQESVFDEGFLTDRTAILQGETAI